MTTAMSELPDTSFAYGDMRGSAELRKTLGTLPL